MKQVEIDGILDWLAGGFNDRITEQTRLVWYAELADKDYMRAMEVATEMVRSSERFPTMAQFRYVYFKRAQRHEQELKERTPDPHNVVITPQWIHIFKWMRSQGDFRPMREQLPYVNEEECISDEEFGIVRDAWVAAGSPETSFAQIMGTTL